MITRPGPEQAQQVINCSSYWPEWHRPRRVAAAKPVLVESPQQPHREPGAVKADPPSWAGSWADMRKHFKYE